jgi:arginine exporter protein ArgO
MVVLIASFFEAHLSIFGFLGIGLIIRNHTYLLKLFFIGSCNLVCHLELKLLFGVSLTVFAKEFLVEGHKMLCFGNISKLGKSIGYK